MLRALRGTPSASECSSKSPIVLPELHHAEDDSPVSYLGHSPFRRARSPTLERLPPSKRSFAESPLHEAHLSHCVRRNPGAYETPLASETLSTDFAATAEEHDDIYSIIIPSEPITFRQLNKAQFEVLTIAGASGALGKVYVARHIPTNFIVAMKKMRWKFILSKSVGEHVERELQIQLQVSHPNIVKMYTFFSDEECLYLLLEFCQRGSLYSIMSLQQKPLALNNVRRVAMYICRALQYLHSIGIIHRDVKPDNILVTHDSKVKLGDFGNSHSMTGSPRLTFCGTPDYLAPEIVLKQPHTGAVDMWALGVTVYELLTLHTPYSTKEQEQLWHAVVHEEVEYPESFTPETKDFLSKLLVKEAAHRMTATEALAHPFTRGAP